MKVNQKFRFVEGAFDTVTGEIKCVISRKHLEVELCFVAGLNIPFAQIKLYGSGLRMDAEATFDDAVNLGKEIARRWNECPDKR
jgi:hypothetical protein